MRKHWLDDVSIELFSAALQKDQLLVGTSDTIIGFLAALTEKSKTFLDETKKRVDKPYIILIGSLEKLDFFVDPQKSARVRPLLAACWPGPLTVIFKAKKELPAWMKSPEGTIAIRVPAHAGLQKLLSHVVGLFSTSANVTGHSVPTTVAELDPEILKRVIYVITEGGEGVGAELVQKKAPSTIIDCTGPEIKVVRAGAFSIAQLKELSSLSI